MNNSIFNFSIACAGIFVVQCRTVHACDSLVFGDPIVTCENGISSFKDTALGWLDTGAHDTMSQVVRSAIGEYVSRYGIYSVSDVSGFGYVSQSWEARATTRNATEIYGEAFVYDQSESVYVESKRQIDGGVFFPNVGAYDEDDNAYHSLAWDIVASSYDSVRRLVVVTYSAELFSRAEDYSDDGSWESAKQRTNLGQFTLDVPMPVPSPIAGAGLPLLIGVAGYAFCRRRVRAVRM